MTQKVVFITSGSTFTIPSDCTVVDKISCIGGGGAGLGVTGGGGNGGDYAEGFISQSVTPSSTVNIQIGSGGVGQTGSARNIGGDTFWNGTTVLNASIVAKGGNSTAASVGTTINTGGAPVGTARGAGGAGGPNGAGGSPSASSIGGSGDNGFGGAGGGAGPPAAPGSPGAEWTATAGGTAGSGGGGGGSGQISGVGGAGGLYGGGGGTDNATSATGGTGAQGIIVLFYTPTVPATPLYHPLRTYLRR